MYIADGVDYIGVSEVLVFPVGSDMSTEMEFTFTVINDNLCDGDENVMLEGANLCNRGTFSGGAQVIITDDDGKWHHCMSTFDDDYLMSVHSVNLIFKGIYRNKTYF